MAFAVGLTGGIGSGKTTISDLFAELGVDVIDTDEIARELSRKGQPAMRQIEEQFGPDVIASDGSLDRDRMRELVFSDPDAREKLQQILHPLIRAEVQRRLAASGKLYALVVVPLLVESRGYDFADRVLVVDCSEERQIERVMQRSGLSRDQAKAIMVSQASRNERLAAADDVINNDGKIAALRSQVEKLHRHYLTLAESA
ncbi:MAG: dephospho-CoA kinase [Betaproteobacteria bacterium]|nr:MAG: dephospho-CoA kinase [Betaproteobacteria bacterium]